MSFATHSARIINPIPFTDAQGQPNAIPIGPCLVEGLGAERVNVFWGPAGEESALLQAQDVEVAESSGDLVLLD